MEPICRHTEIAVTLTGGRHAWATVLFVVTPTMNGMAAQPEAWRHDRVYRVRWHDRPDLEEVRFVPHSVVARRPPPVLPEAPWLPARLLGAGAFAHRMHRRRMEARSGSEEA